MKTEGGQKYQILAAIAGFISILSFASLVLRVHLTKEAEQLTYTWLFMGLTSQILVCIYGYINNSYGLYVPTLILISGLFYILYVKLYYP